MADVFLSYAREDAERARSVAAALEHRGVAVWWDQQLIPGVRYSDKTEAVLTSADVILVLWTQSSIKSMWVADEAMIGREKGNLIPVSFDEARPPIGFRQIQTMSFDGWDGRPDAAQVGVLIAAIENCRAGGGASEVSPSETASIAPAPSRGSFASGSTLRSKSAAAAAIFVALALLVAAPFIAFEIRAADGAKRGADVVVAVPPFKVSGESPDLMWLSSGLAASLEKALRSSGMQTKGYDFPPQNDVGALSRYIDDLGVDYIVSGLVTRVGPDLLFNVSLVDARTRATVEAIEHLERSDVDFAVMQKVVGAVVASLKGDARVDAVSPQSKDYYVALGLMSDAAVKADFERAADLLRAVTEKEPQNGEAYAHLAYALASVDRLDDRSDVHADAARDALKKAFGLLGEHPEAYFASGMVDYVYRDGADRLKRAEGEIARALELDPGDARALKWMTGVQIQLGEYSKALRFADKALVVSPSYLDAIGNRISALVYVGRRDEARAELDAAIARKGDWSFGHRMRASIALADGDLVEALNRAAIADAIEPIVLNARLKSIVYANLGMAEEANVEIERDGELSRLDPAWRSYKKQIVAGEVESALASLDGLLAHEMREAKRSDPLMAAGMLRIYLSDYAGAEKNCSDAVAINEMTLGEKARMSLAGACAAIARARLGDRRDAEALIDAFSAELSGLPGEYRPYWDQSILASLLIAAGRRDLALQKIDEMVKGGWRTPNTAICRHCVHLAVDDPRGLFGDLRDEPRFAGLMASIRTDLARQRKALSQAPI